MGWYCEGGVAGFIPRKGNNPVQLLLIHLKVNKRYCRNRKTPNYWGGCCEGRVRTSDLRVMSPTSYRCSTSRFRGAKVRPYIFETKF